MPAEVENKDKKRSFFRVREKNENGRVDAAIKSIQTRVAKFNDVHYQLRGFVRPFYMVAQLVVNIVGKLIEGVLTPFAVFERHLRQNLSLRNEHKAYTLAWFQDRMPLILKLPVDLATGLFKALLSIPLFFVKAPYELLKDALEFTNKYSKVYDEKSGQKTAPGVVRLPANLIFLVLFIPTFVLHLVNNALHQGLQKQNRNIGDNNISLAGFLNNLEWLVNGVAELAADIVIQVITLPATIANLVASKRSAKQQSQKAAEPTSDVSESAETAPEAEKGLNADLASSPTLLASGGPAATAEQPASDNVVPFDQAAPDTPRTAARKKAELKA